VARLVHSYPERLVRKDFLRFGHSLGQHRADAKHETNKLTVRQINATLLLTF
jgi:hypothetical protein